MAKNGVQDGLMIGLTLVDYFEGCSRRSKYHDWYIVAYLDCMVKGKESQAFWHSMVD
jgi:hypothetical protein